MTYVDLNENQGVLSEQDDAISRILVDARLSTEPLPDFPIQVPESLEQAYAIQAASIERWPDEVAGWKVAMLSPADRARLGAERLVGPVFRSRIHRAKHGDCIVKPVYERGFAAVEAEIVLELGTTVPPETRSYSDAELIDLVGAAYCGAEIASSPMAVVNERGATSVISDLGNSAGVIVGPEIPGWHSLPPNSVTATVTVDDAVVGQATVESLAGNPLNAFRVLVEHCARYGIELPAGTVVSSGAITGVHEVTVSSSSRVDYGDFGRFDVTYEPLRPVTAG